MFCNLGLCSDTCTYSKVLLETIIISEGSKITPPVAPARLTSLHFTRLPRTARPRPCRTEHQRYFAQPRLRPTPPPVHRHSQRAHHSRKRFWSVALSIAFFACSFVKLSAAVSVFAISARLPVATHLLTFATTLARELWTPSSVSALLDCQIVICAIHAGAGT
jgi:hypothetical protein